MDDSDMAQAALKEKYDNDRAQAQAREVADILVSPSLEAGRIREKWARDAGLKIGHVGN
jgi:phosphotransacetylase